MTAEVITLSREQQKRDWLDIHTVASRIEQTTHNADERAVARRVRELAQGEIKKLRRWE